MTKTRKSVKIRAIKDCVNDRKSIYKTAHKYKIAERTLAVLVGITKRYGIYKALHLRNHWNSKGWLKVVRWKINHQTTYTQASIKFGIRSVASVYNWVAVYKRYGRMGLKHYHQGQPHKHKRFEKLGIKTIKARARSRELSSQTQINYLKKTSCLKKVTSKQIAKLIIKMRKHFPLKLPLEAPSMPMSTFQYWRIHLNKDPDRSVKNMIKLVWDHHKGRLGVRRITGVLRRVIKINHKRVQRLMHLMGLKCTKFSKRTRKYDSSKGPKDRIFPNYMNRRFMTDRPYQKYTTDVTEFKVKDGEKLYLEPIIDLYNNQVVTYAISRHPNMKFALKPLKWLVNHIPHHLGYKPTLHTDQGWQYTQKRWCRLLKKNRIRQSMSRKATCLDNACAESFFSKLKAEIGPARSYNNYTELYWKLRRYIHYYNYDRTQQRLHFMSPIEYKVSYN